MDNLSLAMVYANQPINQSTTFLSPWVLRGSSSIELTVDFVG